MIGLGGYRATFAVDAAAVLVFAGWLTLLMRRVRAPPADILSAGAG
jgi:hypothetical protein